MSQSKVTESNGAIKSEDLVKAEKGEMVAAALNNQHPATNASMQQAVETEQQAQAVTADEKIEIAKKENKDKDGRDNQNAETIQIVSETAPAQNGEAMAQGDNAYVEQDAEGYSFLEGASDAAGSPYALSAAGAAAGAGAAASGAATGGVISSIGSTIAGLSTVAQVGLATLGAAAAAAAVDDDDDAAAPTPTPDPDPTPEVPATPTGGLVVTFEGAGFTDNGDGTYTPDEDFNAYGSADGGPSVGAGVVTLASDDLTEVDGTTDRIVLKVTSPAEAAWWGGVTLVNEYSGSDLIGDGSEAITMRVYALEDGDLNLELEATGETAFIVNETVTQGWNTVSFDVSGADASVNWNKVQLRTDALGKSDGLKGTANTYYIDDIHFPSATIVAPPAGPQEAASVPTVGNAEFDVYVATNADGSTNGGLITNVAENWGQAGTSEIEVHPSAGAVIKLSGMNYQGMSMTATDVSAKTSFHIDMWAAEAGSVKLNLINNADPAGEAGIVLEVTADEWNSFDIDLAAFGTVATDAPIHQLKFDSQSAALGDGVTPLTDFYIDNMYFGDQAATIGTPPADPSTAEFLGGGTTPTALESDVVSIFSDEYTDVAGTDFMTQYSNGLAVTDVTIDNANVIKKYENNEYAIIENTTGGGMDVSTMNSFKFSIYRTEATDLLVKVRDFGANGSYNAPADGAGMDTVDDSEAAITLAASTFTVDTWNEVTITKAELETAGVSGFQNVANIVLDPSSTETFYIDDMYWVA